MYNHSQYSNTEYSNTEYSDTQGRVVFLLHVLLTSQNSTRLVGWLVALIILLC